MPEPEGNGRAPEDRERPGVAPSVSSTFRRPAIRIGDIAVSPFTISHDAADPVGFVFRADGVRWPWPPISATFRPTCGRSSRASICSCLERNHDLEMLRDGPYPWSVKQQVLFRVGHLSNEATAEFLENGL